MTPKHHHQLLYQIPVQGRIQRHLQRLMARLQRDPRHWQVVALGGLFVMAWQGSDFGTNPTVLLITVSATLGTQWLGGLVLTLRGKPSASSGQWKSAFITALGISLLLRASNEWIWFAAGVLAIAGKFLLRVRGKHVFNPACSGIVAMLMLVGHEAWVSPGQWGQANLAAAYAVALAALTLSSARRLDIALGFLGTFAGLTLLRGLWLGDPLAISLHQLSHGSLLIFAFFMITDPRSTPDSRRGRLMFAAAVATLAALYQWGPNLRAAPLLALASLALLTPLLDHWLPRRRFQWLTPESEIPQQQPMTPAHPAGPNPELKHGG